MTEPEPTQPDTPTGGESVVDVDLRVSLAEISTRIDALTQLVEYQIRQLQTDVTRLETRVDAAWGRLDRLPSPKDHEAVKETAYGTARRLDRVIWGGIGLAAGGGGVAGAVSAAIVQALGG